MAQRVGGTEPGAEHDLAIPFTSIREILDRYKARDPDKTALVDIDQETSITWGELHEEANRIANVLAARGMPAWKEFLSPEEVDAIKAYVAHEATLGHARGERRLVRK